MGFQAPNRARVRRNVPAASEEAAGQDFGECRFDLACGPTVVEPTTGASRLRACLERRDRAFEGFGEVLVVRKQEDAARVHRAGELDVAGRGSCMISLHTIPAIIGFMQPSIRSRPAPPPGCATLPLRSRQRNG